MPSRLERLQSPSRRRLLARVDGAAFLAGARLLVVEEGFVQRRQVFHQVRDLDLDAMHQRAAVEVSVIDAQTNIIVDKVRGGEADCGINRYSNVILKNKSCRRKSMSDRRPA